MQHVAQEVLQQAEKCQWRSLQSRGTCLAGASNALELEAAQAPHLYGHLSYREGFSSCKGLIPHQACSASTTCVTDSHRDSSHLPH